MPGFEDLNQLWLFLAFFIPGFVSLKVWDLFVPTPRRDFSKLLTEVFGYSALNHAPLAPLWILLLSGNLAQDHPFAYRCSVAALVLTGFVVLPIAWPVGWLRICEIPWVARRVVHPLERPWDWVFRRRLRRFVIVTLKDGRRIAGLFGKPEDAANDDVPQFATSNPTPEQLYLTRAIRLDAEGRFLDWVEDSRGVLVLSDIQTVEFFWPTEAA